jgi:branched-chain amino acid transport system ATP-binding protein
MSTTRAEAIHSDGQASMAGEVLATENLTVGYGAVPVVHDVSIHVAAGEVVALLGPNGAGKSTTIMAIAGVLPIISGEVRLSGQRLKAPLHRRAKQGLSVVTEGRSVFMGLSTATNLALGRGPVARALELFPELVPLMSRRAGLLSGGEQQILTLARALAARPVALVVDELSLGLAPLVVRRLLDAVRAAADDGIGVLLVEQHARQALALADRGYVLQRGRVELEGTGTELIDRIDEIEAAYLHQPMTEDQDR